MEFGDMEQKMNFHKISHPLYNCNMSTDIENPEVCGCGGGQSCIVDRRKFGDWVHEDDVLKAAGLPVRENCLSVPSQAQTKAMKDWFESHGNPDALVYTSENPKGDSAV